MPLLGGCFSARDVQLMAFAHLGADWAPCGQLTLTEEGPQLLASSFAYGLNYLRRLDALEVDPVSLGLAEREAVRGKRLLPAHRLSFFGGIRDAAPDAWGRRVIEEGEPIPVHLDAFFHDGSSLGGARPKASVRAEAGVLWLAKFASRRDAFDVPGIECAVLELARRAGRAQRTHAEPGRMPTSPTRRGAIAIRPSSLPTPGGTPHVAGPTAAELAQPAVAQDHRRTGCSQGRGNRAVVQTFGSEANQINDLVVVWVAS